MAAVAASVEVDDTKARPPDQGKSALTPPTSEEWNKRDDASSELSDIELEDDEDIGEIEPDHYYDGGKIPVFKPTMYQFRSFKKFVDKIDKYGMKSGIVKVIPPQEWRDSLPALDEAVKTIKVKNPITQEFSGTHGTYTQANIEKQRSYNLPQWKALTEESQNQPPAKRGERRKTQEKPQRTTTPRTRPAPAPSDPEATPVKRGPGRPRKHNPRRDGPKAAPKSKDEPVDEEQVQVPPTPTSPESVLPNADNVIDSPEYVKASTPEQPLAKKPSRKSGPARPKGSQAKSISERRKYNQVAKEEQIDEAAFKDFDYRFYNQEEFTAERCAELENLYWRTLTFAAPMYGADMPGSLFDEAKTTSWNVAKLENLLDVLGQKVPGVNTAYLYLGMWKATFAWHLEDVDLYSINYIHFGAPKQWYSISQEDARRFENAMKNVWPNDAKHCSQFLRHKTYLISPALLQSQYNIRVNKLVHNEGEFVITFPYGYHSGFNLGYNCAESVNFATEQWLEFGRIAKKCDCEADSVWINVEEIERKLRGEPTPEYYEETDEEDYLDDADLEGAANLPSPPSSIAGKHKMLGKKRKRDSAMAGGPKAVKKVKIRIKTSRSEPCVMCPNDLAVEPLLQTDNGRWAHRVCALFTPETYLTEEDGVETVRNVTNIDKARLGLKCSFCRSKKGACFQCCSRKCTRAYHATCAAAAGVQVDYGPTPVFGDDGTEYFADSYDFRCRFHRSKRPKAATSEALEKLVEKNTFFKDYVEGLGPNHVVQMQHLHGDIFAGSVVENRPTERSIIVDILPEGDRVEVDWKWLLKLDPADSQLPKPSPDAKPLPPDILQHTVQAKNSEFGPPIPDDPFCDPESVHKWAEFNLAPAPHNASQCKVDFAKENQIWFYLPQNSTETKGQYTENLANPRHNPAGNFLETVRVPGSVQQIQRRPSSVSHQSGVNYHALNGAMAASKQQQSQNKSQLLSKMERPYQYKPKPDTNPGWNSIYSHSSHPYTLADNQPPDHQNGKISYGSTLGVNPQTPNGSSTFGQLPPLVSNTSSQSRNLPPLTQPSTISSRDSGTQQTSQAIPNKYIPGTATANMTVADTSRQTWNNQPGFLSGSAQSPTSRNAPMANMSGTYQPSTYSSTEITTHSPTGNAYLDHISQYPYLRNAFLRRPRGYQSPYTYSAGFSGDYVGRPTLPQPSTPSSLAYPANDRAFPSYQPNHNFMNPSSESVRNSQESGHSSWQTHQPFQYQIKQEPSTSTQSGMDWERPSAHVLSSVAAPASYLTQGQPGPH